MISKSKAFNQGHLITPSEKIENAIEKLKKDYATLHISTRQLPGNITVTVNTETHSDLELAKSINGPIISLVGNKVFGIYELDDFQILLGLVENMVNTEIPNMTSKLKIKFSRILYNLETLNLMVKRFREVNGKIEILSNDEYRELLLDEMEEYVKENEGPNQLIESIIESVGKSTDWYGENLQNFNGIFHDGTLSNLSISLDTEQEVTEFLKIDPMAYKSTK